MIKIKRFHWVKLVQGKIKRHNLPYFHEGIDVMIFVLKTMPIKPLAEQSIIYEFLCLADQTVLHLQQISPETL